MLDGILPAFAVVAASEMGDKTQLLAFSLATRFRQPRAVLAGIAAATVVLNALGASVGVWVATRVPERALATGVGVLFVLFGVWTLAAGEEAAHAEAAKPARWGAFGTTAALFFVAELGDKTQLATIGLAARYHSIVAVTAGATLGMLLADGLAVALGEKLADRVPMRPLRLAAGLLFVGLGLVSLAGAWL